MHAVVHVSIRIKSKNEVSARGKFPSLISIGLTVWEFMLHRSSLEKLMGLAIVGLPRKRNGALEFPFESSAVFRVR